MGSDATIADVIVWSNGTVIVFDQVGEEMPNYQGQLAEVRDAILEAAGVDVHFYVGDVDKREPSPGLVFPITREQFAASDLLDQLY
jgi:hypothetical protein